MRNNLQNIVNFPYITLKDFSQFSSFYFLNLTINKLFINQTNFYDKKLHFYKINKA